MTRSLCGKLNYEELVIKLSNQLQFLEDAETRDIGLASYVELGIVVNGY